MFVPDTLSVPAGGWCRDHSVFPSPGAVSSLGSASLHNSHVIIVKGREATISSLLHCKEIWIYVFPEKELRGLSPNFTFMCLWAIYIFKRSVHLFFLQQNRQGIIKIAHRNMNVGIGSVAALFLFWEYLFRIFGIVSLKCSLKKRSETKEVPLMWPN